MPDPRALANLKALQSYKDWQREGLRRSGSATIFMLIPMLLVVFTSSFSLLEPARGEVGRWVVMAGAAMALYLAINLGLGVFAVLRLNAWKRAHPWSPPTARAAATGRRRA